MIGCLLVLLSGMMFHPNPIQPKNTMRKMNVPFFCFVISDVVKQLETTFHQMKIEYQFPEIQDKKQYIAFLKITQQATEPIECKVNIIYDQKQRQWISESGNSQSFLTDTRQNKNKSQLLDTLDQTIKQVIQGYINKYGKQSISTRSGSGSGPRT